MPLHIAQSACMQMCEGNTESAKEDVIAAQRGDI